MGSEPSASAIAPDTSPQDPVVLIRWPWRVGRRVGRTIYATPPGADDGVLIGLMDTTELAAAACRAHNLTIGETPQQS